MELTDSENNIQLKCLGSITRMCLSDWPMEKIVGRTHKSYCAVGKHTNTLHDPLVVCLNLQEQTNL